MPLRSSLALLVLVLLVPNPVRATAWHVDFATGVDSGACGSRESPCFSIQKAVDLSSAGDSILVAEGTYLRQAALDPCGDEPAVVCVVATELTILGGFTSANWLLPDPAGHPTIIDGETLARGVSVEKAGLSGPPTSLRLEGFTIRNGRAEAPDFGPSPDGLGGGLKASLADVVLRDVAFVDNVAQAGDTDSGAGGLAAGGGAFISSDPSLPLVVTLERLAFSGNQALGGNGPERGGTASGGGLFVKLATVRGERIEATGNLAQAGSSTGHGLASGLSADALGGGLCFAADTDVDLGFVLASDNAVVGGDAGAGDSDQAGGAFGGGVFSEKATLALADAELRSNTVTGGDAFWGGLGNGGGLMTSGSSVVLERVLLLDNRGQGGTSSDPAGKKGSSSGGGAFFAVQDPDAGQSVTITNSIVADNFIDSGAPEGNGGGGGLFYNGVVGTISHTTLARNGVGTDRLLGQAIILNDRTLDQPSEVDVDHSIIADHTSLEDRPAIHVWTNSTMRLDRGLFAGNEVDTNDGIGVAGTYHGLESMLSALSADFISPGPPDFDYRLQPGSPAQDEGIGSDEPQDFQGASRDPVPDIGADEEGLDGHAASVVLRRALGGGSVTSRPGGIDCGAQCIALFDHGKTVTLLPVPDVGSLFTGWRGDGDCLDGQLSVVDVVACEAGFSEAVAPALVIRKQTVPAGVNDRFSFTGDLVGTLEDGGGLARVAVTPGEYTVTEGLHPDYDLTRIECDDADSLGDLPSRTAVIQVAAGEIVTCTFTNTTTACTATEDDLVLADRIVTESRTEEACNTIMASRYEISPGVEVVFRAGLRIVLGDGFVARGRFVADVVVP